METVLNEGQQDGMSRIVRLTKSSQPDGTADARTGVALLRPGGIPQKDRWVSRPRSPFAEGSPDALSQGLGDPKIREFFGGHRRWNAPGAEKRGRSQPPTSPPLEDAAGACLPQPIDLLVVPHGRKRATPDEDTPERRLQLTAAQPGDGACRGWQAKFASGAKIKGPLVELAQQLHAVQEQVALGLGMVGGGLGALQKGQQLQEIEASVGEGIEEGLVGGRRMCLSGHGEGRGLA